MLRSILTEVTWRFVYVYVSSVWLLSSGYFYCKVKFFVLLFFQKWHSLFSIAFYMTQYYSRYILYIQASYDVAATVFAHFADKYIITVSKLIGGRTNHRIGRVKRQFFFICDSEFRFLVVWSGVVFVYTQKTAIIHCLKCLSTSWPIRVVKIAD